MLIHADWLHVVPENGTEMFRLGHAGPWQVLTEETAIKNAANPEAQYAIVRGWVDGLIQLEPVVNELLQPDGPTSEA